MNSATETSQTLQWKVFTQQRLGLRRDLPPGKEDLMWVANSSTLISGERDAVLVDTFIMKDEAQRQADWVAESGKNLVAIYVTHPHGDHFFGLSTLLERFPKARAFATPDVVTAMPKQFEHSYLQNFWQKLFPGQIPDRFVVAEPLVNNEIELEGQKLIAVTTGGTDAKYSTVLHVPSIDLIVAGDTVYNGIHPYLGESDKESRLHWVAVLDELEALKPKAVVAGHKVPSNDDNPRNIGETRQYLIDFARLDTETADARSLYDAMLAIYPKRVNPGSLWGAALAAKDRK